MHKLWAMGLLGGGALAQSSGGSGVVLWWLVPGIALLLLSWLYARRSRGQSQAITRGWALEKTTEANVVLPKLVEFHGRTLSHLATEIKQPLLGDLTLQLTPAGSRLVGLPGQIQATAAGQTLQEGSLVNFDQELQLWHGTQHLATVVCVPKLPHATAERWGRGQLALAGGQPVSFFLGGLKPLDLGQRLNVPSLNGFVLLLGEGGMRIVSLPQGLEVKGSNPGDKVPFGAVLELQASGRNVAKVSLSGLEGVPVPAALLDYTGARPEQLRKSLALFEPLELSSAFHEPSYQRLRLGPAEGGAEVLHIPGNLTLSTPTVGQLEVGHKVAVGQSIYIRDVSSRLALGIIDVLEP